jgi:DHA2 family multidrug resistance protein
MLVLHAIAGASSGTFYTLTLTFVAPTLPPKLLLFGVAAYAMDIVVTSHVAALIEGWYVDHLSWHWIFWTAAVLTPVMVLCIYFGVPAADNGSQLALFGKALEEKLERSVLSGPDPGRVRRGWRGR